MILVADIGNSYISLGGFDSDELVFTARLSTDIKNTEDEYASRLLSALGVHDINKDQIDGAIISSVVPPMTPILSKAINYIFGVKPLLVGPGIKTGVNIRCDIPSSVGADIICDCVAAHNNYGSPALIIDFGTATKMIVIDENCTFIGLSIIPGVLTGMHALADTAAQLPEVSLDVPSNVIGKNTADCMRSGIVFGNASLIDGMIERICNEFGKELKIIATGGIAKPIVDQCKNEISIDENLILKGLNIIYSKNNKN